MAAENPGSYNKFVSDLYSLLSEEEASKVVVADKELRDLYTAELAQFHEEQGVRRPRELPSDALPYIVEAA